MKIIFMITSRFESLLANLAPVNTIFVVVLPRSATFVAINGYIRHLFYPFCSSCLSSRER